MSAKQTRLSDWKESNISSPSTPSTPSNQVKRVLASPEFPVDTKKNKVYLSPLSETDSESMAEMEVATGEAHVQSVLKLEADDIAQISNALTEQLRAELSDMVKGIVQGVLSGLNEKIQSIERENKALKNENKGLKSRIQKLETEIEGAEQYSRRNCLRISGIPETGGENTDDLILKMAGDINADVSLQEIDRSHRVGRPRENKPRDIIVKLSTFRVRQRLFKSRTSLKTNGYAGVFMNEDLTKFRSGLMFTGRKLVKEKRILGAWSSNGTILFKDNEDNIHRIQKPEDLAPFESAAPRPN
ncbi:MAG: hypothetical protein N0E48_24860 [Candidatus Thiodiazotropha endolucinida]|nr:hypothetical protein [Candidatus Thiodiazotropha taylori]MCW4346557.1 hypothetical protein [Candidatus Thiodiazotropha endolucinida]